MTCVMLSKSALPRSRVSAENIDHVGQTSQLQAVGLIRRRCALAGSLPEDQAAIVQDDLGAKSQIRFQCRDEGAAEDEGGSELESRLGADGGDLLPSVSRSREAMDQERQRTLAVPGRRRPAGGGP